MIRAALPRDRALDRHPRRRRPQGDAQPHPRGSRDTLIALARRPRNTTARPGKRCCGDTSGAKALLAKGKRNLYPLPDLVRLLGTKWPIERLEGW